MTDQQHISNAPDANGFTWHPEYQGKSFESVERQLADDIRRDQQAYHLTLESAEKEEFGAFQTVRDIEKRWSDYDFGWFDIPPDALASRIMAFERERESRQELIDWRTWRAEAITSPAAANRPIGREAHWEENLSDDQPGTLNSTLALGIVLALAVICAILFFVLR